MTTALFGKDPNGFWIEANGKREYVPQDLWQSIIDTANANGINTTNVKGDGVKLKVSMTRRVDKYDGDPLPENLVESIEF